MVIVVSMRFNETLVNWIHPANTWASRHAKMYPKSVVKRGCMCLSYKSVKQYYDTLDA